MTENNYIELNKIDSDRRKTKVKNILNELWTATKEVFGTIRNGIKKLFKKKPNKNKDIFGKKFMSGMSQVAKNLDSWEKKQSGDFFKPTIQTKTKAKRKTEDDYFKPSGDFFKPTRDLWR